MAGEVFETGKAPVIVIKEVHGDLAVQGWSEPRVSARGEYEANESDGALVLTARGDLKLMVPPDATLQIGSVHGDAAIRGVIGQTSFDQVRGDAVLVSLGQVKAGEVHGDLAAKNLDGSLALESVRGDAGIRGAVDVAIGAVHGDCVVRQARGSVSLNEVSGDFAAHQVEGSVTSGAVHRDAVLSGIGGAVAIEQVRGDIRLVGPLANGEHTLNAHGDAVVRWPSNSPLTIQATSPRIVNKLDLEDCVTEEKTLTGRIGKGGPTLAISARGRLVLKEAEMIDEKWEGYGAGFASAEFGSDFGRDMGRDLGRDMEALGEQIRQQVEEQMTRIGRDLETRFGPEFSQRISDQVTRKAERAAEKAERTAERIRRKEERGGRFAFTFGGAAGANSGAAQPAAKKVDSTAEQLKILKMVENGTISPDEASMLLEALDG